MELAAAALLFLLSHVLIARGPVKGVIVARWGKMAYLLGYSAVSLVLASWVIAAFLDTPRWDLWPAPDGAHEFAVAVTFVAFVFLGVGLATPNPVSVTMRRAEYDPEQPGVVGAVRHPVLWGFGLWGTAHLPANGDSASLFLFGGVILFAFVGAKVLDRRHQKRLGLENWRIITDAPARIDRTAMIGAALGAAAWVSLLRGHPYLFGVDPWAMVTG
jgi:uncharacterized membrane protein